MGWNVVNASDAIRLAPSRRDGIFSVDVKKSRPSGTALNVKEFTKSSRRQSCTEEARILPHKRRGILNFDARQTLPKSPAGVGAGVWQ